MIDAEEAIGAFFQQPYRLPVIFQLTEQSLRRVFKQPTEDLLLYAKKQQAFFTRVHNIGIYFRAEEKNAVEQAGVDVHELTHGFIDQHWPELCLEQEDPFTAYTNLCLNEGLAMYVTQQLVPDARTKVKNKILKRMRYGKNINELGLKRVIDEVFTRIHDAEDPPGQYRYGLGMLYVGTIMNNSDDPFKAFSAAAAGTDIMHWPELIDPNIARIYK